MVDDCAMCIGRICRTGKAANRDRDVSLRGSGTLAVLVGHGPGEHFSRAAAVPARQSPEPSVVNVSSAALVALRFRFRGRARVSVHHKIP